MSQESSNSSDADPSDPFLELIDAARRGDQEAVGKLIEDCRPYLLMIANSEMESQLGAKAGASDLVQNAMVSAHRCLDNFQGKSRQEWLGWLRAILLNDVKQERRKYRAARRDMNRERPLDNGDDAEPRPKPQLGDELATPSQAAIRDEESALLHRALSQLKPEDRQVIELCTFENLTYAQVGEKMGRSAEAVRKLYSRAFLRLQKVMESPRESEGS